jgi:hypothetical protein
MPSRRRSRGPVSRSLRPEPNWTSGYFEAEVVAALLGELGSRRRRDGSVVARVVAQEDGTPADSLVLVERGQRLHVGRVLGLVMRRFVELTLGFLTATQTSGEPITRESTVDGVHRTVHESVHELLRALAAHAVRMPSVRAAAQHAVHEYGSVPTTDQKVRGSNPFGRTKIV